MSTITPRFRIPDRCPHCQELGSVRLETTVVGDAATVQWQCRQCQSEWPVTTDDYIERRRGVPERRTKSRKERRSKAP